MKVIFLDIDGVLNTSDTYDCKREIDEFRLEYLKQIVDKTDAKIVLSSSLIRHFENENGIIVPRTLMGKRLYDFFQKCGIKIYDKISNDSNEKEEQIQEWLSTRDDIDSFVIIDDEPSMFFELYDRLIQTSKVRKNEVLMNMNDCTGLCEKHIRIAVDMLNSKVKTLK